MKTLLLIRPQAQSDAFLAQCREALGRDLPAIVSPILHIEPVGGMPDLAPYETVIVTSGNAVERLPQGNGQRVVTVGERTADLAASKGYDAVCLGQTVDDFLTRRAEVMPPALYLRGRHTRVDLAGKLNDMAIETAEQVVYDQQEQPLTASAENLLASGEAIVPVFSPRTARLLSAYHVHEATEVFLISQATAEAWSAAGQTRIAERPRCSGDDGFDPGRFLAGSPCCQRYGCLQ